MTKKFAQYLTTLITNDIEGRLPEDSMDISSYECEKVESALAADKFDDVEKWLEDKTKKASRSFSVQGGQARKSFWQKHRNKILAGAAAALAVGGGAYAVKKASEPDMGKLAEIAKDVKEKSPTGDEFFVTHALTEAVGMAESVAIQYNGLNGRPKRSIPATIINDLLEAIRAQERKAEFAGYGKTYITIGGIPQGTYSQYLGELRKRVEQYKGTA